MRKHVVLAAVVLSVLAGLLTVAYARSSLVDAPDVFELRRTLIERIETSVTEDDIGALQRMEVCSAPARAVHGNETGPTSVESSGAFNAIWCRYWLRRTIRKCQQDYRQCVRRGSPEVSGAIFGCIDDRERCMDRAYDHFYDCLFGP